MTTTRNNILIGDCRAMLRTLPERSVHCVVTSPPYWGLRVYGTEPQTWADGWSGELGSEPTPEMFTAHMVEVFAEVHRVLRDDGTLWLNIGDCYATGAGASKNPGGRVRPNDDPKRTRMSIESYPSCQPNRMKIHGLKTKDLVGIPWRLAFALQAWGWYLRADCIWHKPNVMPSSVTDRPTTNHEMMFLLSKRPRYFYDRVAVMEPATGGAPGNKTHKHQTAYEGGDERHRIKAGLCKIGAVETRNLRSVWRIPSQGYKGCHFATFPPRLVEPCIKAGTSEHGVCPTCGAPWVRQTARERVPTRPAHVSKTYVDPVGSPYEQHSGAIVGNRDPERHITRLATTGWQQSCKCEPAAPVPAIVLDPFLGSGTTAVMAAWLGRDWLGTELNPGYAQQARERIAAGYTPPKSKRPRRSRHRRQLLLLDGEPE